MTWDCQRCQREPATLELAFRSGLGWTESAVVCSSCCNAMCAVTKTAARIVALDTRPAWLRRGTSKDLTGTAA